MAGVAVLGTGIMGAPMARNIAASGQAVTVWNRSRDKADPLDDVADVADSAAAAVSGVDVVVTMLADGPVVDEVMRDAASGLRPGTLWLQMSTVGGRWSTALATLAADLGLDYVDAPVLGTRQPAQQASLTVMAAGNDAVCDRAQPVFDAVGSRTIWLDEPGQASRLKLVVNAWIAALTGALAESVALSGALDIDPARFLDAIEGGAVGAPYARIKGDMMRAGDYPTSFPAALALKDTRLVLEAADDAGVPLGVASAVSELFARAVDAGHGDEDMSVVRRVL